MAGDKGLVDRKDKYVIIGTDMLQKQKPLMFL